MGSRNKDSQHPDVKSNPYTGADYSANHLTPLTLHFRIQRTTLALLLHETKWRTITKKNPLAGASDAMIKQSKYRSSIRLEPFLERFCRHRAEKVQYITLAGVTMKHEPDMWTVSNRPSGCDAVCLFMADNQPMEEASMATYARAK